MTQDECKHEKIDTWHFPDGPAGMWSCAECRLRFVPMDLEMERDAAAYRAANALVSAQIPLEPEMSQIVQDHFWELIGDDKK